MIARSVNVNYCDASDPAVTQIGNFIVYGNIQGIGNPILPNLTPDMIQITPEREATDGSAAITQCSCSTVSDLSGCDISNGGGAPDFIVLNLGDGYPLQLLFPYINVATINLRPSVRMPLTGS